MGVQQYQETLKNELATEYTNLQLSELRNRVHENSTLYTEYQHLDDNAQVVI